MSSTVADLGAERRAVLDWLRLARHQAVDSYLPDSETVRDSCLDDVAGCDLYVLIAGHRYGFAPGRQSGRPVGHAPGVPAGRRVRHPAGGAAADQRSRRAASDLLDPARAKLVVAFREEVAGAVRPAEFSDLQGLVQGLSTGVQGELAKLGNRPGGPVAAGVALRLAPRPVFLAGREELLADLDARLGEGDGAGPRVAVLCGLGGTGKTSVAVEYAHRHLAEVGVCWQFAAEDPAVLAAEFAALAAELGAREAADARDPVASVHAALARLRRGGWWCSTTRRTGLVAPFVPPAGPRRVWSPRRTSTGRPARPWTSRCLMLRWRRVSWCPDR